jgi:hypothetical protein
VLSGHSGDINVLICSKKSLKIPKGESESVNRRIDSYIPNHYNKLKNLVFNVSKLMNIISVLHNKLWILY